MADDLKLYNPTHAKPMTIIRDAEWKECNEPHGELVLLWNNHRTLVTYYQSRRTGHVYRFLIQDQKWEYAK